MTDIIRSASVLGDTISTDELDAGAVTAPKIAANTAPFVWGGGAVSSAAGTTRDLCPIGFTQGATAVANAIPVPRNLKITRLRAKLTGTLAGAETHTLTLRVDGADSGFGSIAFTSADASGTEKQITGTLSIAALADLAVRLVEVGGPNAITWTIEGTYDDAG